MKRYLVSLNIDADIEVEAESEEEAREAAEFAALSSCDGASSIHITEVWCLDEGEEEGEEEDE